MKFAKFPEFAAGMETLKFQNVLIVTFCDKDRCQSSQCMERSVLKALEPAFLTKI